MNTEGNFIQYIPQDERTSFIIGIYLLIIFSAFLGFSIAKSMNEFKKRKEKSQ